MQEVVRARGWTAIGLEEWREIRATLPQPSEAVIRGALRDLGIPVIQPWRGIELHSLEELRVALTELSQIYSASSELRKYVREQVIASKNRARIISRSARVDPEKRAVKAEMVEWMLIWLSDPALFPAWVELRRTRLEQAAQG